MGNVILYDFCGEFYMYGNKGKRRDDVGQPGIRAGDTMAFLIATCWHRQREKSRVGGIAQREPPVRGGLALQWNIGFRGCTFLKYFSLKCGHAVCVFHKNTIRAFDNWSVLTIKVVSMSDGKYVV